MLGRVKDISFPTLLTIFPQSWPLSFEAITIKIPYPHLKKISELEHFTLYGKGDDYYRRGKFHDALDCYNSVLKIQPNDEFALLRKGDILVKVDEYTKAMECFDQAIELNKNNSDAWLYKAQLNVEKKDYENALKCFDEASNINPDDERIWDGLRRLKSLMRSSKGKEKPDLDVELGKSQKTDASTGSDVLYEKALTSYSEDEPYSNKKLPLERPYEEKHVKSQQELIPKSSISTDADSVIKKDLSLEQQDEVHNIVGAPVSKKHQEPFLGEDVKRLWGKPPQNNLRLVIPIIVAAVMVSVIVLAFSGLLFSPPPTQSPQSATTPTTTEPATTTTESAAQPQGTFFEESMKTGNQPTVR